VESQLSYVFIKKAMKLIVVIIEAQSLLSTSYRILSNIILSSLIPYADEITSTDRTHVRCKANAKA
jgi:hypothetical protein